MSACQTCGACCASYRVQFAVYELDEAGGSVPAALTEPVNGSTSRMRGTGEVPIRCVALSGTVGTAVMSTVAYTVTAAFLYRSLRSALQRGAL